MEQSSTEPSTGGGDAQLGPDVAFAARADELAGESEEDDLDDEQWDGDWDDAEMELAGNGDSKSTALAQRFESLVTLAPMNSRGLSHAGSNAVSAGERKAGQARCSQLRAAAHRRRQSAPLPMPLPAPPCRLT